MRRLMQRRSEPFPIRHFSISSPGRRARFDFETPLPGSKSLTLRDCAIAALADGTSTIRYPGECDDYWRMKDCLRRLGIAVDDSVEGVVRITGRGGEFAAGAVELDVGQSAVTTRLLLAMAALRPDVTIIDGHISMRNRPNKDLVDALARARRAARSRPTTGTCRPRVIGTRALRGPGARAQQYFQPVPHQPADHRAADRGRPRRSRSKASSPASRTSISRSTRWRSSACNVENHDYRRLVVAAAGLSRRHHRRRRRCLGGVVFRGAGDAAWRAHHAQQSRHAHAPGRLRVSSACAKSSARACSASPTAPSSKARARLSGGFDGDVDMTSMPDVAPTLMMIAPFLSKPDAHHRARDAARQGMRPHRRADARAAQARRDGGRGAGLHGHRAASRGRARQRDRQSWKSRPITITASPCPSACSDRACRACGSSIRAAWRRPIRTTGGTGSARALASGSRRTR